MCLKDQNRRETVKGIRTIIHYLLNLLVTCYIKWGFIYIYRYQDGESVLRKVASAAEFIWSEKPIEILGIVTCISFDDQASLPLKEHDLTTDEVLISNSLYTINN